MGGGGNGERGKWREGEMGGGEMGGGGNVGGVLQNITDYFIFPFNYAFSFIYVYIQTFVLTDYMPCGITGLFLPL
jgi:hypothetical protein